jgi:RNA polymerase sigma-70 factor (ECF subfamily)
VRKPEEPIVGASEAAVEAPPPEDHILIRRFLRSGDPRTFEELVERHLPPIRRLLFTLFNGQREEMEDAEQEIILSLFQGLKDFRFRSSFRTYFYRLALWNSEPVGPEQQALRREEIDTMLSIFQTLPSRDRQLILMKDVDGFSIEEIADILEVPSGTVKSRLHRAREKLLRTARRGG